jgi:AcrR family transcriptional regulator
VDLDKLVDSGAEINMYPPVLQLVVGTLTFLVANFHRSGCSRTREPTEEQIREALAMIEKIITSGLEFNQKLAEGIDFEGLEKKVLAGKAANFEDDELFQAVAGAVAETGPWKTSMGMVARRSGMSKSGLYAHFANKEDMLKQFFITEFDRLVVYARAGMGCSELPEEQLYLVIFSIADYLHSRPEILAAANWMRTHRLDLGFLVPLKIYQVFLDIQFKDEPGLISEQFVDWMLFLIINTLMRRPGDQLNPGVTNESFRVLYRFVVLGIKGFME